MLVAGEGVEDSRPEPMEEMKGGREARSMQGEAYHSAHNAMGVLLMGTRLLELSGWACGARIAHPGEALGSAKASVGVQCAVQRPSITPHLSRIAKRVRNPSPSPAHPSRFSSRRPAAVAATERRVGSTVRRLASADERLGVGDGPGAAPARWPGGC